MYGAMKSGVVRCSTIAVQLCHVRDGQARCPVEI